jgi:hypothetical protein
MTTPRLGSISLDCSDPSALAGFWATLLGGEIIYDTDDFAAVRVSNGIIAAVRDPNFHEPTWPAADVPKQMHLDIAVDDLDGGVTAAVEAGATLAPEQPRPESWRVLIDPSGHPFCVSNQIPD